VWKSNVGRPTLSPWPRRLDGVEAHKDPRNIHNITHYWLISTQAWENGRVFDNQGPRGANDWFERRVVDCVEIKFRAPQAIDAMLSPDVAASAR